MSQAKEFPQIEPFSLPVEQCILKNQNDGNYFAPSRTGDMENGPSLVFGFMP